MIDWTRVTDLRLEIGAEDFCDIVDIFLDEVEQTLGRLPGAPPDQLGPLLHFLKGSALNLGFRDFARLCQEGEAMMAGRAPGTPDLGRILSCYEASKQSFLGTLADRFAA